MEDESARGSATGRVLGSRYRVGVIIRTGGMGSVYEGEHTATGRKVALKLVHLRPPARAEIEHRFEREARIASNIQSKHVVQVFDAGRDEELGPFMAMELLRGEDLEERLARAGALPPRTACEIAFQAARGLEKAHAANVAHRDLKPGNVFLVESDEDGFLVKVLDFGIATLFGEIEANAKLTRAGTTLGTPQYMSPEQARGHEVDARTDIYSLGAVLFEMIAGRSHVPELANYNQLVIHIATEVAPRLSSVVPEIDPRIDRLVADMLTSDRRDRLQSMRMVRERLGAILGSAASRLGSTADASGAFALGRAVSGLGLSSARIRSALPVAPRNGDDDVDSEGVHFFDRDSLSPLPAALPIEESAPLTIAEPPSSRDSEKVVLFDRASLPPMADRTSSGAHVIDDTEIAPQRMFVSEPPPRRPFSAPPTSVPARRASPKAALIAVALVGALFLTVGSVRFAQSFDSATSTAPASASLVGNAIGPAAEIPLVDPTPLRAGAIDAGVSGATTP